MKTIDEVLSIGPVCGLSSVRAALEYYLSNKYMSDGLDREDIIADVREIADLLLKED